MARVPSYRLHKPSGKAVCTINGRDHYLGPHGTKESKRAYSRLIEEWSTAKRSTSFGLAVQQVTVAILAADYLDYCKSHYPVGKHNSETNQTRLALMYLEPYYDFKAIEVGPLKLKTVREKMLATPNASTGKPLTRQYVNKMVDRIVRMYRWGAQNEMVPIAVYQALANVKGLQRGRTTACHFRLGIEPLLRFGWFG
jgi:hypothetical protein